MNDCYYFLYSKCSKGTNCKFRHCYSSKENPVLCKNWEQKKSCRATCPFRHSDYHLKKTRYQEPCYWESTPAGCNKDFCEFKHKNSKKDEWKNSKVKTLEEIKIQKEKLKKSLECTVVPKRLDKDEHTMKDEYLDEIERELEEIDNLLTE